MRAGAAFGFVLGVCLGGCQANEPRTSVAIDPCTTEFVEVTSARPACGIGIAPDGSILVGTQHHPPIVLLTVGPADDEPGEGMDIVAKSLVLSPPAPGGRFRLLRTCPDATVSPNCHFSSLADLTRSEIIRIEGGSRWLGWSPEGRYAATFGGGLHVVDTKTGSTHSYPDEGQHWFINEDSFAWIYEDSFVMTILKCDSCEVERYKFVLP